MVLGPSEEETFAENAVTHDSLTVGRHRLNQNIADSDGLRAAYAAYHTLKH